VEKAHSNPLKNNSKTNLFCGDFKNTNMIAEFQISGIKISAENKTFIKYTGQFSLINKLQISNMEVTKKNLTQNPI